MSSLVKVIGVDLGGTNVRAGRVEERTITASAARRISSQGSAEVVLEEIFATIEAVFDPAVAGIGIGVPSIVDVEKGIVFTVENIPSWKEVALKDVLEKKFGVPVFVNNDANCFALGEFYFGKGIGSRDLLGMVIGTGLGVGVIINKHLYAGANCGAGEIGTIPYKDHTIEYYASGSAFKHLYGEDGGDLFRRACQGEARALEIFSRHGCEVGHAVMTALYAYDPELIVLGGSVSKAFPFFEKTMWATLQGFAYQQALSRLKIVASEEPQVALLGAAGLVLDQYPPRGQAG
jgi:glucokinase